MHDPDFDLPEFVGADKSTRADPPKGKRAAQAAQAAPKVAVYVKPAEGEAHPKIARQAPANRLDAAEAELSEASLELTLARQAERVAVLAEADALSELTSVLPRPSQADVHRELIANEQAAKLARVQAGQPAIAPKTPTHGKSPVDIAAAQRPRNAAHSPNGASLRSQTIRR